jgi:hypothetical protein
MDARAVLKLEIAKSIGCTSTLPVPRSATPLLSAMLTFWLRSLVASHRARGPERECSPADVAGR